MIGHDLVRPAPAVPVEPFGNRLRGEIALEGAGIVIADDRLQLADSPVANQLHGLARWRVGPLHLAGLKHAMVFAHGLDHHSPLADRMAQGLFAVHVLARLAGMDAGQVVPVLRRGIDDDVHVLAVQQRAVVLVGLAAIILGPLLGTLQIEIGHGHDPRVGGRLALPPFTDGQLPISPPATDDPYGDLPIGRRRAGRTRSAAVRCLPRPRLRLLPISGVARSFHQMPLASPPIRVRSGKNLARKRASSRFQAGEADSRSGVKG